jgi:hypothetical protein
MEGVSVVRKFDWATPQVRSSICRHSAQRYEFGLVRCL